MQDTVHVSDKINLVGASLYKVNHIFLKLVIINYVFCILSVHDIVRFKPTGMEGPVAFVIPELSDKTLLNVSIFVCHFTVFWLHAKFYRKQKFRFICACHAHYTEVSL